MMYNEAGLGLAADSDFFDWSFDQDRRFFVATDIVAHGYSIPRAKERLETTYKSKLPRSAS